MFYSTLHYATILLSSRLRPDLTLALLLVLCCVFATLPCTISCEICAESCCDVRAGQAVLSPFIATTCMLEVWQHVLPVLNTYSSILLHDALMRAM